MILNRLRLPESDIAEELVFCSTLGPCGIPLEKRGVTTVPRQLRRDTFNLIISRDTTCVPKPLSHAATFAGQEVLAIARAVATEMMNLRAALALHSQDHVRVVCFLNDGTSHEMESSANPEASHARYLLGIGTCVNPSVENAERTWCVETHAGDKARGGDPSTNACGSPADDLYVDWGGLPSPMSSAAPPDLFADNPHHHRRYSSRDRHRAPQGKRAGGLLPRHPVTFSAARHLEAAGGFWQRRIDDLMSQDWLGSSAERSIRIERADTQLGLDYRLMTQFTSFVASKTNLSRGSPSVEVRSRSGRLSHEGVFGQDSKEQGYALSTNGHTFSALASWRDPMIKPSSRSERPGAADAATSARRATTVRGGWAMASRGGAAAGSSRVEPTSAERGKQTTAPFAALTASASRNSIVLRRSSFGQSQPTSGSPRLGRHARQLAKRRFGFTRRSRVMVTESCRARN